MMYEYEKPKCKFLNRLSTLLQLHPTPAAHLFSRLCGLHTVSAPQFPVSPSGLTKPRPQDSSAPRTAAPPGRLLPQDGSAPRTAPPLAPSPVRPLALQPRGQLSSASHRVVRASRGLTLYSPQNGPRFRSFTTPEDMASCLPELCQTPEWCFSKEKRASALLKRHRASDQNRGHRQSSDVAVVHQDDEQRSSQTSEVAWLMQKSL